MFSKRFCPETKNELTVALEAKKRRGEDVLDLTESNPTRVGLEYPSEGILDAIINSRSLTYSPSPLGLEEARQAVSLYYSDRGRQVPLEDIILTCSTSEAYGYLFKLLTEPGDQVFCPEPSYPLLDYLLRSESLQGLPYTLSPEDNWKIHGGMLAEAVTDQARAILLVDPNNPTGSLIGPTEWAEIRQVCRDHQLAVICDEVFWDYPIQTGSRFDLLEETDTLTFALNGLSKTCGLPQMKAGWIVLRGPDSLKSQARDRLEIIADTYLSVSTPVQWALPKLLDQRHSIQQQIRGRLQKNYSLLHRSFHESAATVLPVQAGWYCVIRLPQVLSEDQWVLTLLDDHNVLAHPGYFYNFPRPAFLVLSLLPESAVFQKAISRLLELVKGQS